MEKLLLHTHRLDLDFEDAVSVWDFVFSPVGELEFIHCIWRKEYISSSNMINAHQLFVCSLLISQMCLQLDQGHVIIYSQ